MDKQTQRMIGVIFSEALIVDVDMSCWSKKISLYCIADYMHELTSYERGPLFRVDLFEPITLSIELADRNQDHPEVGSHPFWRVSESSVKQHKGFIEVSVHSRESYPKMKIVCKDIWAVECDQKLFEQVDPESGSAHRSIGFRRPSIEQINTIIREGRKEKRK